MKQPQSSGKGRKNTILWAFLVPPAVMLAIYFVTSVAPFGDNTLLYSDNFHQYYPFFRHFREALRSGESLLWDWSVGMGMDYLALISYYLASPLNLLTVILPESWMLPYFTLLMPIKLGLASGFFALMLKKVLGKDDWALPLFGAAYALCAWALGYQWNIMWLDGFALLPLVVLGTISLLRDGKYLLYTLSLALAVGANYYVGFFVCIFVFLLFWCYEICRFRGVGRLIGDLCAIGFFTVLALGMTTFLTLPALNGLRDTYSSVNQFPTSFDLNMVTSEAETAARTAWRTLKVALEKKDATISLWLDAIIATFPPLLDGMRQVAGQIGGGQTPTYMEGLPNLYCGVFPIALGWLFLLSRDVRLRDKICAVFLLGLLMCSFLFRQLDYVWHGLHFTNQIPYRFSFLFSFVVLYMAWQAWLLRSSFPLWKILLAAILSVGVLLFGSHSRGDYLYWLFNLAFLALYLICMLAMHSHFDLLGRVLTARGQEEVPQAQGLLTHRAETLQRRHWVKTALTVTMAVELVLHTVLFFSGFSIVNFDYPLKEEKAEAVFQQIPSLDSQQPLFYRTEVTHAQTLNDGALNGYQGVTTFSSSANVAVTRFMHSLGMEAQDAWNRYCYKQGSPVANLFLNLKYLVERTYPAEGDSIYSVALAENGLTVLENRTYLPLGFLAEPELADQMFASNNRSFKFQNRLFLAATGVVGSVWTNLPTAALTVSTEGDMATIKENVSGWSSFSTTTGGTLIYTYEISKEGYLCLDVNLGSQDQFSVWRNGTKLYDAGYYLPQIVAVGDVEPGDEVQVRVKCKGNQSTAAVTILAATLNEEIFMAGYEVLSASTLQLTEFSTTRIRGEILCDRDGLMYTSIPQDGNWSAYVDGEPAEITLVGECMISLPLTQGAHTIELRYENTAFRLGALISGGCAAVFVLFVALERLSSKKKKKA